jgi:FkbM family methyltransferase
MTVAGSDDPFLKRSLRSALPSSVWNALGRLRLRWTLATFRRRIVQHHYAGVPLRVDISDPVAAGWYDRDWREPPAIELLRQHRLREGAVVFDIGAHQGIIALILARSVGPSGRVVALEAMPFNAAAAARNRELNEAPQLTIVQAAAAESPGLVHFSPRLNSRMDSGPASVGNLTVKAVTIDHLALEHGTPDILYIDVEGFECHVLRGASRTLASRPDCIIEVHAGCGLERSGGSLDELLRFFPEDDYALWMMADEKTADDEKPCWPLDRSHPMVRDLFQLGAISRRPGSGGRRG